MLGLAFQDKCHFLEKPIISSISINEELRPYCFNSVYTDYPFHFILSTMSTYICSVVWCLLPEICFSRWFLHSIAQPKTSCALQIFSGVANSWPTSWTFVSFRESCFMSRLFYSPPFPSTRALTFADDFWSSNSVHIFLYVLQKAWNIGELSWEDYFIDTLSEQPLRNRMVDASFVVTMTVKGSVYKINPCKNFPGIESVGHNLFHRVGLILTNRDQRGSKRGA